MKAALVCVWTAVVVGVVLTGFASARDAGQVVRPPEPTFGTLSQVPEGCPTPEGDETVGCVVHWSFP